MTAIGRAAALALVASALQTPSPAPATSAGAWLQWGGPSRNFMLDAADLATTWPAGGPAKRWTRMLGEGHSSVLARLSWTPPTLDRGTLYVRDRASLVALQLGR